MNKTDNRVRYTKMVLQNALLKILQKKHIDKVTITEICEEASINRGTFYLHYNTPNDLLMEIEQQFLDETMKYFTSYFQIEHETSYLASLFKCFLQNAELCRIIMGKNGNPRFLDKIKNLIRQDVVDNWQKEFPHYTRNHLDFVFDFVFSGSMQLILNWIDDEDCISTNILANRLDRLGHYCHLAIAEFSK